MTTIVLHSFNSLKTTFEARASEWALTGMTLTMAMVCFFNETLFQENRFLHALARAFDQETWSWAFLIIGGGRCIVLLLNGLYWRTPLFRMILAFLTCFIWFRLTWGVASNFGLGLALFPWLFLLDAYNALRAGKEAGIAQFGHNKMKREQKDAGLNT